MVVSSTKTHKKLIKFLFEPVVVDVEVQAVVFKTEVVVVGGRVVVGSSVVVGGKVVVVEVVVVVVVVVMNCVFGIENLSFLEGSPRIRFKTSGLFSTSKQ